jgi:hypothetical protein
LSCIRKNECKLQPFRFAVFFQSDLVLRDIVVALPSGVLWMLAWLVFGSKESKKTPTFPLCSGFPE